jgi:hypothetical protein
MLCCLCALNDALIARDSMWPLYGSRRRATEFVNVLIPSGNVVPVVATFEGETPRVGEHALADLGVACAVGHPYYHAPNGTAK